MPATATNQTPAGGASHLRDKALARPKSEKSAGNLAHLQTSLVIC